MIGGTSVRAFPVAGTPIGELAEGTLIKINENGSPVEFYVADHNYQSDLNGNGRTLMVRRYVYDQRQWNSEDINIYRNSTIRQWLNNTYKTLFSTNVQSLIGVTEFEVAGSSLNDSVFLLSYTELGFPPSSLTLVEGEKLSISRTLVVARQNGSKTTQWTRSSSTYGLNGGAWWIDEQGVDHSNGCTLLMGSRPCFTLPSTTKVDDDLNLIV